MAKKIKRVYVIMDDQDKNPYNVLITSMTSKQIEKIIQKEKDEFPEEWEWDQVIDALIEKGVEVRGVDDYFLL